MDKKRILIATLFIIFCIGLGYLIYRVFFYKEPTIPATKTSTSTANLFPRAGEGDKTPSTLNTTEYLPTSGDITTGGTGATGQTGLPNREKQVIQTAIVSPSADKAGTKFYNQADGKFYRITKDGKIELISDKTFYNVQNVTWSPAKNEGIMEYPDGSKIYYNFDTKKQATLPSHWIEFSFSPQGDKIAAKSMGLAEENRWLITSDPDGKNGTLLEPMGENSGKVTVDWSPSKQIVAMSRTGEEIGDDRQEVLFVGQHHENFKSTIVEGRDFREKWSPEGKKLLYSVHSERTGFRPELWIVNAEGDNIGSNRKMLGFNTWADKCTFGNERYVYCAVPNELDVGAGFAPGLADTTPDTIYKIDLNTGGKTTVPTNAEYTINNMFLSSDGKFLYFTDKNKNGLFNLPL